MRKWFFLGLAAGVASLTGCSALDLTDELDRPTQEQIQAFRALGFDNVESVSPNQYALTKGDCLTVLDDRPEGWVLGQQNLGSVTPTPAQVVAAAVTQHLCITPSPTPSPSAS